MADSSSFLVCHTLGKGTGIICSVLTSEMRIIYSKAIRVEFDREVESISIT